MVHVRGHWRAGSWVRAHTRRAPGAAAGGAGLLVLVGLLLLLGHNPPTGSSVSTQWQSGGLTFTSVGSSDAMACGEHSYGQVQQYLRANSCRSLFRVLLDVHDNQNHQMPNHKPATHKPRCSNRPPKPPSRFPGIDAATKSR